MPAKSKAQQRFMGMVHAFNKGELKGSEVSKDVKDAAKSMKKKDTKDFAKTKHKGLPNKVKKENLIKLIKSYLKQESLKESGIMYRAGVKKYGKEGMTKIVQAAGRKASHAEIGKIKDKYDKTKKESTDEGFGGDLKGSDKKKFEKARKENGEQLGYTLSGTPDVKEERDYKAEYKKYGSSTKAKKYRAELNKYNRQKGTYGNGDGKDASHKGGKIVGFEAESKNRGRAEKSRLKKESINEARTINVEPNWEGMWRFFKQMAITNPRDWKRMERTMGSDWKKIDKMAQQKGWKFESVNETVIKENLMSFYKYMGDFYGKKGIYPDKKGRDLKVGDINKALSVYLKKYGTSEFEGDTLDRERVRDILIKMRKLDPDYSKKESVTEGKNPKREKVKKDFKTSLNFAKGAIRKIETFMKSDYWGMADRYVTDKRTGLVSIVKDMEKSMNQIIKMPVDESINESVSKRITVKEVKKWMKTLEEFRYKRISPVDARRVTSFINNKLKEEELPQSLQKKWSEAKYSREKYLAARYLKSNKNTIKESKDCCDNCKEEKTCCSVSEEIQPQGNIKKVLDVVKNKQHTKIGGTLIDATTAGMMAQVWDKVNDSSKEKMNKMNVKQLINLILKLWKAVGTPRL